MQPVVDGLKQQYSSLIKFAEVDFYDPNIKSLVQQYRAPGHPTFVVVDGEGKAFKR